MAAAKSTPVVTEAQAPVDDSATDAVKVQVRSTPTLNKTAPDESSKSDLTVHHELKIMPSSDAAEKPVEVEVPVIETKSVKAEIPEPDTAAPVDPVDAVETPSHESPKLPITAESVEPSKNIDTVLLESPKPPSDDAPKTDPMPNNSQIPSKPGEMQSPKVFDTKQYHLPIDEGAAGGKGKSAVIFLVVLVFLVVGAVVAIDAGWVKLGFDLPFDLIK